MSAHFADFSSLLLLLAEPYKKKRHSVHPSPLSDRCGSCLPHSLGYCSWFNRSLVFSLCISQDPLERTSGRVFALRVCAESFDSSLTHHSPLRSSMAKIGSVVQVLSSADVSVRHPSLVGQCGRVHSADASSWCTVQLESGLLVNLRTVALRMLESVAAEVLPELESEVRSHSKRSIVDYGAQFDHASHYASSIASALTVGAVVTIVATENVQQRAPQRVGERGVVKEVPVHPITWFKVQFSDGKVLAFRPSALALLGEGSAPPSKPLASSGADCGRSSRDGEESILHQTVLVVRGRLQGVVGRVVKSGNGWVQLSTAQGEVAKRVHEVRVVEQAAATDSFCSDAVSLIATLRTDDCIDDAAALRNRSDSVVTDSESRSPEMEVYDSSAEPLSRSPKRSSEFDDGEWLLPPRKESRTLSCSRYFISDFPPLRDIKLPTILSHLESKQF